MKNDKLLKELANLKAENKEFLFFTERVARSPCQQQLSGTRCICFSCQAHRLIAKHAEASKAPRYGTEPHTVAVDDPHKEKGNQ